MTIQFFPLFFEYSLDMTPVQVSLLYSITYATMGFGSILTERCAKKTGRITMIFVARVHFFFSKILFIYFFGRREKQKN